MATDSKIQSANGAPAAPPHDEPAQSPDQAMIASGELARAEEIITGPDAPPVYPPAMVELFEEYGETLGSEPEASDAHGDGH